MKNKDIALYSILLLIVGVIIVTTLYFGVFVKQSINAGEIGYTTLEWKSPTILQYSNPITYRNDPYQLYDMLPTHTMDMGYLSTSQLNSNKDNVFTLVMQDAGITDYSLGSPCYLNAHCIRKDSLSSSDEQKLLNLNFVFRPLEGEVSRDYYKYEFYYRSMFSNEIISNMAKKGYCIVEGTDIQNNAFSYIGDIKLDDVSRFKCIISSKETKIADSTVTFYFLQEKPAPEQPIIKNQTQSCNNGDRKEETCPDGVTKYITALCVEGLWTYPISAYCPNIPDNNPTICSQNSDCKAYQTCQQGNCINNQEPSSNWLTILGIVFFVIIIGLIIAIIYFLVRRK